MFTRLRVRGRVEIGDREVGLETIAHRDQEGLVVVGLTPHGMRIFAIRQTGRDVEVDAASSREMRYLAFWVLDALHRSLWIQPTADFRRGNGGTWSWHGEQIREFRRDDRWRREFRNEGGDADEVAPVVIDYRGSPDQAPGSGFEIRNAWCGYEALFVSLDESS